MVEVPGQCRDARQRAGPLVGQQVERRAAIPCIVPTPTGPPPFGIVPAGHPLGGLALVEVLRWGLAFRRSPRVSSGRDGSRGRHPRLGTPDRPGWW
jgi:hypothetical protein